MTAQHVIPIRLIKASTLESVRLRKVVAESRIRTANELAQPSLNIGFGALVGERSESAFSVVVRVEATVRDESVGNPESSVRVAAEFDVRYSHPGDLNPTDAELEGFADTNAVLNAWPYLRELVQSTSVRMGLPPITLPLFRMGETGERVSKPVRSETGGVREKRRRKASVKR